MSQLIVSEENNKVYWKLNLWCWEMFSLIISRLRTEFPATAKRGKIIINSLKMEKHEREYITDKKCELMELIHCNPLFLAKIGAHKVITNAEIQQIKAISIDDRVDRFLDILMTRTGAYAAFEDALKFTKQTGALKLIQSISQKKKERNYLLPKNNVPTHSENRSNALQELSNSSKQTSEDDNATNAFKLQEQKNTAENNNHPTKTNCSIKKRKINEAPPSKLKAHNLSPSSASREQPPLKKSGKLKTVVVTAGLIGVCGMALLTSQSSSGLSLRNSTQITQTNLNDNVIRRESITTGSDMEKKLVAYETTLENGYKQYAFDKKEFGNI